MRQKNSSIFSSKLRCQTYLIFGLSFYALYLICFILFIVNPSIFYYRAWEFYDEVGYCIPNKLKWNRVELGDESRQFIYSFQKKWPTQVSVDHEGFRAVPILTDTFPILFTGDSHTWGSGLSDEETIPKVHPKRFFLPLKLLREFNFKKNILNELKRFQRDEYTIPIHASPKFKIEEHDIEYAVQNIAKRSSDLEQLGYHYIFAIIPSKTMQLSYHIDPKIIEKESLIARTMDAHHIHYIDFCHLFREAEDVHRLYIPSDSHLSKMGASLIANVLTDYLKHEFCGPYALDLKKQNE